MNNKTLRTLLLSGLFALVGCRSALRPADLLFHVSEVENAITAVTPAMIDHVAIVVSRDSVIEAVGCIKQVPHRKGIISWLVCAVPTDGKASKMHDFTSDGTTTGSTCPTTTRFIARNSFCCPLSMVADNRFSSLFQ